MHVPMPANVDRVLNENGLHHILEDTGTLVPILRFHGGALYIASTRPRGHGH